MEAGEEANIPNPFPTPCVFMKQLVSVSLLRPLAMLAGTSSPGKFRNAEFPTLDDPRLMQLRPFCWSHVRSGGTLPFVGFHTLG